MIAMYRLLHLQQARGIGFQPVVRQSTPKSSNSSSTAIHPGLT
jgi:hypothetical protein